MQGLKKLWLCAAAFGLTLLGLGSTQAQAQSIIVPNSYVGFPAVVGPVYTPVPTGVVYAPAYRYVAPVTYSYNVQTVVPTQVTQTTYYVPTATYVAPAPVVVPASRVTVYPRRGVVRVRY
jgi:hypothetical protein